MTNKTWRSGHRIFKVEHDRIWQCIYNFKPEFGFFSKENASFNLEENRFSLISHIDNTRLIHRYNASFEFLLEYPNEFPGKYNHWFQSTNPAKEFIPDTGFTNASGYTPIHIDWSKKFGGLTMNTFKTCILDGRVGEFYWNYAIGDFKGQYKPKTPGPPNTNVSYVILWIRIKSARYFKTIWRARGEKNTIFVLIYVLLS